MPLMLFYREGSEGTEKQPAQENIPTNGGTRIPTKETPFSTVPVPQCYPPFLLHSVYILGLTDPVITGLSGCLGVPTSLAVQHSPSPSHPDLLSSSQSTASLRRRELPFYEEQRNKCHQSLTLYSLSIPFTVNCRVRLNK